MSNKDYILFKICLNKFNLLNKINNDNREIILDEIFSLGYNSYLRNYIKNDFINNEINNITENKNTSKGILGETLVYDILVNKFSDYQIENTSKTPHSGDIQITIPSKNKIIIEVKNYNKTIDQDQIDKIKFDMKFSGIYYAIFISLNSGIVGKKRFEIEIFYYNKQTYFIIFLPYSMHKIIPNKKCIISHNSFDESVTNLTTKLEFSICIIQSISEKLSKTYFDNNYDNDNLDFIISELNNYYDEFKIIKNSTIKMEENIKKILESHSQSIKDYENSIKNNINKLINKKINNICIKKIFIKKNSINNWNITINSLIYGKIVFIKNKFDFYLNYNQINIWEQYDTLEECKHIINKIY